MPQRAESPPFSHPFRGGIRIARFAARVSISPRVDCPIVSSGSPLGVCLMASNTAVTEFRAAWLPHVTDDRPAPPRRSARQGQPAFDPRRVHSAHADGLPRLAHRLESPARRAISTTRPASMWLSKVAGLNPATSAVILAWDRAGNADLRPAHRSLRGLHRGTRPARRGFRGRSRTRRLLTLSLPSRPNASPRPRTRGDGHGGRSRRLRLDGSLRGQPPLRRGLPSRLGHRTADPRCWHGHRSDSHRSVPSGPSFGSAQWPPPVGVPRITAIDLADHMLARRGGTSSAPGSPIGSRSRRPMRSDCPTPTAISALSSRTVSSTTSPTPRLLRRDASRLRLGRLPLRSRPPAAQR